MIRDLPQTHCAHDFQTRSKEVFHICAESLWSTSMKHIVGRKVYVQDQLRILL